MPLPSASLEDLDLTMFRETYIPASLAPDVIAQNQRSIDHQLLGARLVTPDNVPTVSGVLAIGRDPTQQVPGAYVQFLRIDGTQLVDPIVDQKVLSGPLAQLLRLVEELLELGVTAETDVTSSAMEQRTPDYPIVALQQLVRNAVLHRTYEGTNSPLRITWFADRVEIQNPGGPFGQVSVDNFGQPGITDYRNPTLAAVMRTLGYVQRFGIGIEVARNALADNGNPQLEFDVDPHHVAVVIRRRQ